MRIFWDVDTQRDFMNSDGALYVPGAEEIKPNLRRLTEYASENFLRVLGSVDRHFGDPRLKHREGELQRYGGPFPDHCMTGTIGAEKIEETVRPYEEIGTHGPLKVSEYYQPHFLDEKRNSKVSDIVSILKYSSGAGVYFEKQSYDVFTNPSAELVLEKLGVTAAVVYGVATDYCVKAAVLGMQRIGIQTYVVTDAIKGITPEGERSALEEMVSAGAKLVTTSYVLQGGLE